MKKTLFSLFWVYALIVLVSCDPLPEPPAPPTEQPTEIKITIAPTSVSLLISQMHQLVAKVTPEDTTIQIIWTSSDSTIVTVDNIGRITAIANGTATITASAVGCTSGECLVQVNTPEYFSRKFLIEHFTGDQCGYCPGGMYAITKYVKEQNPSAIWISHHYGYNTDEYTINESSKICKMLGVSGAPNMVLNRTKQQPGLAFHPGYLPEIATVDDSIANTSVVISHTYNTQNRQLDMTVSGYVLDTTITEYLLSVLIKENRLVGKQADYEYSWGGSKPWKEYMHARVVRDFLTSHFGDTVLVQNQKYSKTLSYTIDEQWIPENCCIVAYLTPLAKKPIVNAEQVPLIIGTMGGEQYYPYGITEGKGPNPTVEFDSIQITQIDNNLLEVKLFANKSIKTNFGSAKAVGIVHINTTSTTLATGSYPIQDDNAIGTITAGYRIDEETTLGGSKLAYAKSSDLAAGTINILHQWRMQSGVMTVNEDGSIDFVFNTYNGSTVTTKYSIAN